MKLNESIQEPVPRYLTDHRFFSYNILLPRKLHFIFERALCIKWDGLKANPPNSNYNIPY